MDPKDLEIERLQQHIKSLQENVGSWRRLAQGKGPLRSFIRQGFGNGKHHKVYAVQDIPGDLPILDVLKELEENFLPTVYPFEFERVDWSAKYNGWLVQVTQQIYVNIRNTKRDL